MGRSRLGRGGSGKKKKEEKGGEDSGKRACLGLVVNLLQCLDPLEGGAGAGKGEEEGGDEGGTAAAAPPPPPPPFARVLSKFREADFEKLDRLVELASAASSSAIAHDARVAAREKLRAEERGAGEDEDDDDDDDDEDAKEEKAARKLVARLAAGGDDLQLCALAAAYCWASFSEDPSSTTAFSEEGNRAARARFIRALHARSMTLGDFRRALEERQAALGGGSGGGGAEGRRLERLLSALGGGGGGGGGGKAGGGGGGGDEGERRPGKRART